MDNGPRRIVLQDTFVPQGVQAVYEEAQARCHEDDRHRVVLERDGEIVYEGEWCHPSVAGVSACLECAVEQYLYGT